MGYVRPDINAFKIYFNRDFPFGIDPEVAVTDADIQKAFSMVNCGINECLFPDQDCFTQGYLLLAAHNLVMNLRASSQGLSGQFDWLTSSKSVGSVSISSAIPDSILKNPMYSMFSKTNYGAMYLNMIYPFLIGVVFTVPGGTRP